MTKTGVAEQALSTTTDSGDSVSTSPQDHVQESTTALSQDIYANQPTTPVLESPIQRAIERNLDQRQEHQLYASVWGNCGAILLKVVPSVTPEYRRQAEELQNQIDLVVAEKKKRGKRFDPRDPRLFDRLVSMLGEQGARDLITSIDTAIGKHGVGLQNNPKAVAELLTEISKALTSGGVLAKLGVSAQAVENIATDGFAEGLKTSAGVAFEPLPNVRTNARSIKPADFRKGESLTETLRLNTVEQLTTRAGIGHISAVILGEASEAGRVHHIKALKSALGDQAFETFLEGYADIKGEPLISTILSRKDLPESLRQKLVEEYITSSTSLMPAAEMDRFKHVVLSNHALIRNSIAREQERAKDVISSLQAQKASSLRHLAEILKLEGLETLPSTDAQHAMEQVLRERFPKLENLDITSLPGTLHRIIGEKDSQKCISFLNELGIEIPAGEPQSLQIQTIKQELLRIADHLSRQTELQQAINEWSAIAEEGSCGESHFTGAEFALYQKILGISNEDIAYYDLQADMYRRGLDERIQQATGSEKELLCKERDHFDWKSVSVRVDHYLQKNPPNLERVKALLSGYQTNANSLGAARTAEYSLVAGSILELIDDIVEHHDILTGLLEQEHSDVSAHIKVVGRRYDQDLALVRKTQQEAKEAWFSSEPKRLLSVYNRQLGESTKRYNQSREDAVPYQLRLNQHKAEIESAKLEALHNIFRTGSTLPTALGESISNEVLNRPNCLRVSSLEGGPEWTIKDEEPYTTLGQRAKSLEELYKTTLKHAERLVVRPSMPLPFHVTGSEAAENALHKLNAAFSVDPALEPSEAALEALRECVVESDVQAFKELAGGGTPREQMDRLYARLDREETLRVQLFLLTFESPSFISRFEGTPTLSTPKDVWTFLQSANESEESRELSGFLELAPAVCRLRKATEALASLDDQDRQSVENTFQQLSSKSIGEALLDIAPVGELRSIYLHDVVGSAVIRSDDLRALYPEGVVPANIQERTALYEQLVRSDGAKESPDFEHFEAYLRNNSREYGELQAALPVMVQLNRTDAVLQIKGRLDELERAFEREVSECFGALSPDEARRRGLHEVIHATRALIVQARMQEAMDPTSEMSRKAYNFLKMLESEDVPFGAIEDSLRSLHYSESQMRVFEALYSQHAGARQSGILTGNLVDDIGAKSKRETNVSGLIQGGDQLTAYDLEQLTIGIRTGNPQMTLRAMISIKARQGLDTAMQTVFSKEPQLREAWNAMQRSESAKVVKEYYNAVLENDTVKQGVLEISSEVQKGAHRVSELTGEALQAIGSWTGEQKERAGALYKETTGNSLGEDLASVGSYSSKIWNDLLSSEPARKVAAGLGMARESFSESGINLNGIRDALSIEGVNTADLLNVLNEEVQNMQNSWTYVDGKRLTVTEYVRLRGGDLAEADASILAKVLDPSSDPLASLAMLDGFLLERERLVFQMEQADKLYSARNQVYKESQDFFVTIANIAGESQRDFESRYFTADRARVVRDVDDRMKVDQRALLVSHRGALSDILTSREVMRVRSVAILEDLISNQDRGLSADSNDRDFRDLRVRDSKHEWIVARRESVNRWQRESEYARKRLADMDWWVNTTYTVGKAALIVGVSFIPGVGPIGAFALATAINIGEKTYRVHVNGLDFDEALRQGAWDLALDAVLCGLSALRVVRITAKGGEVGGKLSKPLRQYTLKADWRATTRGAKFVDGSRQVIATGDDLSRGLTQLGTKTLDSSVKLTTKAYQLGQTWLTRVNKTLQPPDMVRWVDVSVRGLPRYHGWTSGLNHLLKRSDDKKEVPSPELKKPPLEETLGTPTAPGRSPSNDPPLESPVLDTDVKGKGKEQPIVGAPTPAPSPQSPTQKVDLDPLLNQLKHEASSALDQFQGVLDEGLDLLKNYEGLLTEAFARLFPSNEGPPPPITPQPPQPPTPPGAGTGSGDTPSGSTGGGEPPSGGSGPLLATDARGGNSYTAATDNNSQPPAGEPAPATVEPTTFSPEQLAALRETQDILNDLRVALQDPQEVLQQAKDALQPHVDPYLAKVREGLGQFENYLATLTEATTSAEQNASVNLTAEQIAQAQETALVLFNQSREYLSNLNTSANELAEKIGAFVADVSVHTFAQKDVETASNTVANVRLNTEKERLVAQDAVGNGQQTSQVVSSQAESQSNSLRETEKDNNRDGSENSQVAGAFMHAQRERLAESQRAAHFKQDSNLESIDRSVAKKDAGSEQAEARGTQSGVADGTFMHVRREQEAHAIRVRNAQQEQYIENAGEVHRRASIEIEGERGVQNVAETTSSKLSSGDSVATIEKGVEREQFVEASKESAVSFKDITEAQNVERRDATIAENSGQQAAQRQSKGEQSTEPIALQDQLVEQQVLAQKEAKAIRASSQYFDGDSASGSGSGGDVPRYSSSDDTGFGGDSAGRVARVAREAYGDRSAIGASHANASPSQKETVSTEAQKNAVNTILTTVGVTPSRQRETPALDSMAEDFAGQATLEGQEGTISATVEQLVAKLSEQVGKQVKEASTFLATFEDAPRMLTADSSSTSLLDGANISVSNATSLLGDAIEGADLTSAKKVMHAKQQRAIKRSKNKREIEVIIQVLLTRQMEALKRDKLLRMLLALGISEVEYRGLIVRLGELEVAKQAREAESQKMQEGEKQAQALLVEGTLKAPEPPTMKDKSNDPSAPPTMEGPGTTRGNLYKRLLEEKAKAS